MTACTRCGTAVSTQEQFCGTCGEYLDWERDGTQHAPAADTHVVSAVSPVAPQVSTTSPPPVSATTSPPAPVPVPPPVSSEPAPVRPGQVMENHRPRPSTVEHAVPGLELLGADQVRCSPCGAANDQTRKFCRRCGASLVVETTAVVERRSWWRRLFHLGPKKPKKWHAAGYRRSVKRIRIMRIIGVITVVGIVLAVIATWPARSYVDSVVNSVKDRFSSHVPVVPSEVSTSSSAAGSKAANLLDGIADEYWAPVGDGVDEWVEADFASPIRLVDLVVSSGASRTREDYLAQARPEKIELVMTDSRGKTKVEEVTLVDEAEPQTFKLGMSDVVSVKLTIKSAYGYERGKFVALAELEFFARK